MSTEDERAFYRLTPITDINEPGDDAAHMNAALPSVRLPPGAPLGLAILATARYRGVGAALNAYGDSIDGLTRVRVSTKNHQAAMMEQVRIDALWDLMPLIMAHDKKRVRRSLWLEELKQLHEIEDYLAAREHKGKQAGPSGSRAKQSVNRLNEWIMGREEILEAVAMIKKDITAKRGGDANLTEADHEFFEDLDEIAEQLIRNLRGAPA